MLTSCHKRACVGLAGELLRLKDAWEKAESYVRDDTVVFRLVPV